MNDYSKNQITLLVILRMLIGWHFLYEGIVKVYNPEWSAKGYLMSSEGIFQGVFQSLAASEGMLNLVDFLNQWGLVAIGLSLLLGLFTRPFTVAGALLLAMYYLAHPPFAGLESPMPTEGSYLIVNKNLIEMFALLVLVVFPTSQIIGVDRLIQKWKGLPVPE